jgi:hypothetical protein
LRREQQKRNKDGSEDDVSIESAESEEPRKKLKTLLREKGIVFFLFSPEYLNPGASFISAHFLKPQSSYTP